MASYNARKDTELIQATADAIRQEQEAGGKRRRSADHRTSSGIARAADRVARLLAEAGARARVAQILASASREAFLRDLEQNLRG
ncbi:MAG: hypothetical protein Greene041619_689 [Candidatus Peregrinibacteria bacterium Greene0416_19]|nr:MAG: hypothetical protein Greene041619_689 [Candidatus Peregrinibacteria bacterium Greene0416_19]